MYGYNESFVALKELLRMSQSLNMVQRYRDLRAKDGVNARFVLFSPIAYENTGDPNLPEGTELNANLAAYTEGLDVQLNNPPDIRRPHSPTFQLSREALSNIPSTVFTCPVKATVSLQG